MKKKSEIIMIRRKLFISILCCTLFILGCPGKKKNVKERIAKTGASASAFYDLGAFAGQTGKFKVAIDYFNKAIKIKPDYSEAYGDKGLAYYRLGQFNKAEDMYKTAIELNPSNASALMNYAILMLKYKRYEEGQALLEDSVRADPKLADALYNLAHLYEKLGKYNDAIYAYKRMIEVKPKIGGLHYQLGLVYLKKEMYNEGLDNFLLACKYSPKEYTPFYQAAVIQHMKKQFSKSVLNYKMAIKLKSSHIDSYINLGDIYLLELHDLTNAKSYYRAALAVHPTNNYAQKRLTQISKGKFDGFKKIELKFEAKPETEKKTFKSVYPPKLLTEYISIKNASKIDGKSQVNDTGKGNGKKSNAIIPVRMIYDKETILKPVHIKEKDTIMKPVHINEKEIKMDIPNPAKEEGKHLQFDNAEELKKLLKSEGIK